MSDSRKSASSGGIGIVDFFGLAICFGLIFLRGSPAGDPGIGWHLKSGEWMSAHRTILTQDPFLLLSGTKEWIHNQWLSDVLFWKAFELGGWPLLQVLLCSAILLLYIGLLASFARRHLNSEIIIFLALLLAAMNGSIQWFLRPVIISFLIFAYVYISCFEWSSTQTQNEIAKKRIWRLPIVFLLWANLHPGFILGLGLLLFMIASQVLLAEQRAEGKEKIPLSVFIAFLSTIATLINPYGWKLYQNIFGLFGDSYFMNLNMEWLRPEFHKVVFWPLLVTSAILLIGFFKCRRQVSLFSWTCLAVFGVFSFLHRRYIPFLAIVSVLPVAIILQQIAQMLKPSCSVLLAKVLAQMDRKQQQYTRPICSISIWLLLLTSTLVIGHIPFKTKHYSSPDSFFPAAAVSKIDPSLDLLTPTRVFHTPDWGGYLTWKLWPAVKPFIDDRNQLNGRRRYEEFFTIDNVKDGWREILADYNFDWALLRPESALCSELKGSQDWDVVHEDRKAVLLHRAKKSLAIE